MELSKKYTKFVSGYFIIINQTACRDNEIELPGEVEKLPDLREIYKKALSNNIPDLPFYFHANHLGSGSLITEKSGGTYQTLAYAPYGEDLVNVRHFPNEPYDERYQFTGYERDEETGLSYAVNRYYWDKGSIMISVDPHAESYPWMGGYSFCSNDPVNRIDPDGMDDYEVDNKGYVNWTKQSDTHVLHSLDDRGNQTGRSVTVKNGGILDQLAQGNTSISQATVDNKSANDVFNVFKFAADNTNVEWSLSGFRDGNKTKFYINTNHAANFAETGESNGIFKAKNMLFNVHSHWKENGAKGGSGYIYQPNMKTGKFDFKGYAPGGSDGKVAANLYIELERVMPMYVYHSYTQGIYQFNPWNSAAKKWLNIKSGTQMRNIIHP
jgi:RHS repeat-associated protein